MAKWKWKNTQIDQFDAGKIWKNFAAYFVLALAVGAMTFFGVCDPVTNTNRLPAGDAATIDGLEVTSGDFRRAYQQAYNRYQQQFKDQFDPKTLNLSSRVLDELVNNYIVYNESLKSGIFATDQEIANLILEQDGFKNKQGKFDGELFSRYLKSQGYSEQSFEDELRRMLTSDKFRKVITDSYRVSDGEARLEYKLKETKLDVEYLKLDKTKVKAEVTQADVTKYLEDEKNKKIVKDYFETKKSEFNSPKKVQALHILSSHKGARNASGEAKNRDEKAAEKRAQDILAKVKTDGADFKALAKQFTDDPSGKTNGGDLGYFEFDAMVKPFSAAAFKTQIGDITGPVKSPFGYHIIKVVGIQKEKKIPLEQAQNTIARKELKKTKAPKILEETANKILSDLKNGSPGLPQTLTNLKLEWQSTGEFASNARFIPSLGSAKEIKDAILKMTKSGQIHDKTILTGGAQYIIRLKKRTEADESKLTDEKIEEIAEGKKLFAAYSFFNGLSKMFQENYKKDGRISLNDEYKNFDQNRPQ